MATRLTAGPPPGDRRPAGLRRVAVASLNGRDHTGRKRPRKILPYPWPMDRSLSAVLLGTFTLRFSTGLTGTMLAYYLAHLREYQPDAAPVSAVTVGLFGAVFYLAELVL